MDYQNTLAFAQALDRQDPLARYREQFHHPVINGQSVLYFTGNSLGLQPKSVKDHVGLELEEWANWGVEGHFHSKNPWYSYHELLTPASARLVGAEEHEVVCMNSLTTNLHLLFVSFYQPSAQRFKILCEGKAFPSDRYLLETQVQFHGFTPEEAIIEVFPREGEHCLREEDIVAAIAEHGDELALVFFGGVNYFTGQFFDLAGLTRAAHAVGALAGFDLAHAVGNLPLALHDWEVDFAAWCTYKYLNASAGNVGGVFIHERHGLDPDTFRFGGWWGHDKANRFKMESGFTPIPGAEGWQLSNAPVLGMAALKASLAIFDEVGIAHLREKSLLLTGFLEHVFNDVVGRFPGVSLEIITPRDPARRGCQLSVKLIGTDKRFFEALTEAGVIADFREPDVVRLAPVPLYNAFEDVYRFGEVLHQLLEGWEAR
ncbi:kynureninase [Ferrimonas balearica]|uniref:kynureninase n=1 Tax=Ferrimonas balearica TaxID=44012 RepID=UPI001C99EF45|nr:kynureninase [Ferrimonas balearica]MBY5990893.1 kynureninase [Ferrimonas balearica]